ncbi:hypothetical protein HJG60_010053 [Phyllostomus discolor]|uniref:Uncharacterized protein n=1 Tax=Phyllostomus discolor TaxID=89673 RepID=A0A834AXI8_9CHIR|nr:hypothetical protein HJG60_010053 [Phyllostomus discolor]
MPGHCAPGPGFPAAPFGVPRQGVAEGPDPPLPAAGPMEAARPVLPARVGWGHGPRALPFWGSQPDCRAFGGCTRGMVGTEAEKGGPRPGLPPSSRVLWGKEEAGKWSRGPLASLQPSLLLLTLRLSHSPACSRWWEASGALGSFSPSAAREQRPPCQWQKPKPQVEPGPREDGGPGRGAEAGASGVCFRAALGGYPGPPSVWAWHACRALPTAQRGSLGCALRDGSQPGSGKRGGRRQEAGDDRKGIRLGSRLLLPECGRAPPDRPPHQGFRPAPPPSPRMWNEGPHRVWGAGTPGPLCTCPLCWLCGRPSANWLPPK